MERITVYSTNPKSQVERKCPFVSETVICGSCGSPNFSIDFSAPHRVNKVSGRCDDCTYTFGVKVAVDNK